MGEWLEVPEMRKQFVNGKRYLVQVDLINKGHILLEVELRNKRGGRDQRKPDRVEQNNEKHIAFVFNNDKVVRTVYNARWGHAAALAQALTGISSFYGTERVA